MIGPFDYHIFAHEAGRYQTTDSSPTLSPAERAALEQYFFGQTNDEAYLSSLETDPAIIWRRVDHRVALTRVLRGAPDADGRATLRFETILIPAQGARAVGSDLARITLSRWQKHGEQLSLGQLTAVLPAAVHPQIISQVVLAFQNSERAVLPARDVCLTDVENVVKRCFHDRNFSLCYKCLNDKAPVAINFAWGALARGTPVPRRSEPAMQRLATPPTKTRAASSTVSTVAILGLSLLVLIQLGVSLHLKGLLRDLRAGQNNSQQAVLDRIEAKSDTVVGDLKHTQNEFLTSYQGGAEQLSQKVDGIRKVSDDSASKVSQIAEWIDGVKTVINNMHQAIQKMQTNIETQPKGDRASSQAREQLAEARGRITGVLTQVDAIAEEVRKLGEHEKLADIKRPIGEVAKNVDQLKTTLNDVSEILKEKR